VTYTENFGFFLDKQAYNCRYKEGKNISSKGFNFAVLPLSSRRDNQFWKYYSGGLNDPGKGFWELNFPYIGTFKREEFGLNTKLLSGIDQTVKSLLKISVYLSPLGWSTRLTLRIYGGGVIKNRQLVKIMGPIMGLDNQLPHPFFIRTGKHVKKLGLMDVFKYGKKLIQEDVYNLPEDKSFDRLNRHFLISINGCEGNNIYYDNMAPADQSLLLSILFGEELDVMDIAAGKHEKILKTRISRNNFALTNFQQGTFLFPQWEALRPGLKGKVFALSENITIFLIMVLSIFRFLSISRWGTANQPDLFTRESLNDNLKLIKRNYKNQFCQSFMTIYNRKVVKSA